MPSFVSNAFGMLHTARLSLCKRICGQYRKELKTAQYITLAEHSIIDLRNALVEQKNFEERFYQVTTELRWICRYQFITVKVCRHIPLVSCQATAHKQPGSGYISSVSSQREGVYIAGGGRVKEEKKGGGLRRHRSSLISKEQEIWEDATEENTESCPPLLALLAFDKS